MVYFGLLVVFSCVLQVSSIDSNAREATVQKHNKYRRDLAVGAAISKGNVRLSPGSNIYALRYDEGLERKAQQWADRCVWGHSSKESNSTGENLYMTSKQMSQKDLVEAAVDAWMKELPDLGYTDTSGRFTAQQFNRGIGHWSQGVWGGSVAVGCGIRHCGNVGGNVVVCNYWPSGNVLNQNLYTPGSKCSPGSGCTLYKDSKCVNDLCVVGQVEKSGSQPSKSPGSQSGSPSSDNSHNGDDTDFGDFGSMKGFGDRGGFSSDFMKKFFSDGWGSDDLQSGDWKHSDDGSTYHKVIEHGSPENGGYHKQVITKMIRRS